MIRYQDQHKTTPWRKPRRDGSRGKRKTSVEYLFLQLISVLVEDFLARKHLGVKQRAARNQPRKVPKVPVCTGHKSCSCLRVSSHLKRAAHQQIGKAYVRAYRGVLHFQCANHQHLQKIVTVLLQVKIMMMMMMMMHACMHACMHAMCSAAHQEHVIIT
jgi:hypothetical protein